MKKIIEVNGLKKSYGPVRAVKDISFYVEQGKLFAFLGPNGAGKSTTIDILCTILAPDEGEIFIDGHLLGKEDTEIRSKIGVVFQDSVLDNLLTVEENLFTRGSFYHKHSQELDDAVEYAAFAAGAVDFLGRRYGKLSGGQRRRADIARALLSSPKVLFLDEPTTGLDPQTRKSIWDTIRELQQKNGTTVFLTTHYMEEAADADYVIVIDDGMIAARGTPSELETRYSTDKLRMRTNDIDKLATLVMSKGLKYIVYGDTMTVDLPTTMDAIDIVNEARAILTNIEIQNGTMDDAFIGITGREIRE